MNSVCFVIFAELEGLETLISLAIVRIRYYLDELLPRIKCYKNDTQRAFTKKTLLLNYYLIIEMKKKLMIGCLFVPVLITMLLSASTLHSNNHLKIKEDALDVVLNMAEITSMAVRNPLLTTEDLIHPHKASNIPGYNGYTPQIKFNCGHTYGYHTDKLTKKLMKNEKLIHNYPDKTWMKEAFLPKQEADKIYVEKMVPGYTGYVPCHRFKFGSTYKEGTEESVTEFKSKEASHHGDQVNLKTTVRGYSSFPVAASYPPPDPSHPGVNVRYATAHQGKHFSSKRDFTEPPLPGYTAFVPRTNAHSHGERYHVWSGNAYKDALAARHKSEAMSLRPINLSRSLPNLNNQLTQQLSKGNYIYKDIGMVPKYTGFMPQERYRFGNTYGDTTRQLPICQDPNGYAGGKYINPGPPVKRLVIRV